MLCTTPQNSYRRLVLIGGYESNNGCDRPTGGYAGYIEPVWAKVPNPTVVPSSDSQLTFKTGGSATANWRNYYRSHECYLRSYGYKHDESAGGRSVTEADLSADNPNLRRFQLRGVRHMFSKYVLFIGQWQDLEASSILCGSRFEISSEWRQKNPICSQPTINQPSLVLWQRSTQGNANSLSRCHNELQKPECLRRTPTQAHFSSAGSSFFPFVSIGLTTQFVALTAGQLVLAPATRAKTGRQFQMSFIRPLISVKSLVRVFSVAAVILSLTLFLPLVSANHAQQNISGLFPVRHNSLFCSNNHALSVIFRWFEQQYFDHDYSSSSRGTTTRDRTACRKHQRIQGTIVHANTFWYKRQLLHNCLWFLPAKCITSNPSRIPTHGVLLHFYI